MSVAMTTDFVIGPEDVLGVNDQALRAAAEPHPGDHIGPYRVESMIGEGGMGRVYRAVGADGQTVALKVVKAELAFELRQATTLKK